MWFLEIAATRAARRRPAVWGNIDERSEPNLCGRALKRFTSKVAATKQAAVFDREFF